jgi:hypothetical protein
MQSNFKNRFHLFPEIQAEHTELQRIQRITMDTCEVNIIVLDVYFCLEFVYKDFKTFFWYLEKKKSLVRLLQFYAL